MARTVEEIFNKIKAAKEAEPELAVLNSTSKVAIWRLWAFITAYAIYTLEMLFDTHKTEVYTILSEKKPHTPRWYRNKALAFQHGFDLIEDTDVFVPPNPTAGDPQTQIDNSKIIKYAAVTEAVTESRLIVKIATESSPNPSFGGELMPITQEQKEAFTAYLEEIKDAGVKITVINYLPDILNLTLKIYRDPLVLDANGVKITGIGAGTKPVETAIKNYLKALPFNGELVLEHLVDALQKVEGVRIPHIVAASSSWIDPAVNTYGAPQNIDVKKIPVSGYFKLADFSGISYVV